MRCVCCMRFRDHFVCNRKRADTANKPSTSERTSAQTVLSRTTHNTRTVAHPSCKRQRPAPLACSTAPLLPITPQSRCLYTTCGIATCHTPYDTHHTPQTTRHTLHATHHTRRRYRCAPGTRATPHTTLPHETTKSNLRSSSDLSVPKSLTKTLES
jgi:hypothetical protein